LRRDERWGKSGFGVRRGKCKETVLGSVDSEKVDRRSPAGGGRGSKKEIPGKRGKGKKKNGSEIERTLRGVGKKVKFMGKRSRGGSWPRRGGLGRNRIEMGA